MINLLRQKQGLHQFSSALLAQLVIVFLVRNTIQCFDRVSIF